MTLFRCGVIALAFATVAVARASPARMSLSHGISIQIPEGWRIAESWESDRSKSSQVYSDPSLAERMNKPDATETVVMLAKRPPEYVGFNPSIQISRTPLPAKIKDITPDKLIEIVLPVLTHLFHDVTTEEWVPKLSVGGRSAAQATLTYAIHAKSGRVTQARASFVVVVDGDGYFMIGMSSPSEGEDDARVMFKRFLAQLRFAKSGV